MQLNYFIRLKVERYFTNESGLLKKMDLLRNFGHNGPEDFIEVGINAKNSEIHAAMGLANLKYIAGILESRRNQSDRYDRYFQRDDLRKIEYNKSAEFNYAYYPLIFKTRGDSR